MDMQGILSKVITSTNEIFEAEAGSVALLSTSGCEIIIQAAVGAGADAVRGLSLPIDKGVIGWVASNAEPALIADARTDPRFNKAIDNDSGFYTESILCVPLKADGHTIGVIELMNMNPNYLSKDGLKILGVIADHAALAIENARLLEQTHQRAEEQAMLFEAVAIITSDLALDTVLDAVSRQMVEALQSDLCIISRWDRDQNQLHAMQIYAGPGIQRSEEVIRSAENSSLPFSVLRSQESAVLEVNADDILPETLSWLKQLNVEALLLIPLIYRRQTIGLVEIGRLQSTDPISHNELRLAETMASQAAVAIEHARLYDETTHRLAEAQALQEVMVAAASTLDFDQVLSGTITVLHRTLGFERLGFFIPSPDGIYMVSHPATIGFAGENSHLKVPIAGSAAGWVSRNKRHLLLPNVKKADHYFELVPDTQSELCVPVTLSGQVVAALNAESPRLNAFSQEDVRLFMAIAAELAIALDNAQLFQNQQRLVIQHQALLDVFANLSSELKPELLFRQIIERAIEVIPHAEAGSLIIPKDDTFVYAAAVGFDINQLRQIYYPQKGFLEHQTGLKKVARLAHDEILKDAQDHYPYHYEQFVNFGRLNEIKSSMRASLHAGDIVLGSINVDSLSTYNAFTPEDEQTLLLFASQAAIAIQNARLFEEIRAAEANYRDLFDNANDFIFTIDSNFRISSANKGVLESTGYQLDEIIGLHINQFVEPDYISKLFKMLKNRLSLPQSVGAFEIAVRGKEQKEMLLEVTMRVRRQGRKAVSLHCIARDITQRRELERQLRQTENLSTIGKLVAGVAHELNNPLTSIIGYASLLQETNLPPAHLEDLQIIFRQAERARVIVRDLLTFARKIDLKTQPVDINEVVHTSLALMKPHLQEQFIQVTTSLDFGLSKTIADPNQLEQVFVNLITNSVQVLATTPREGHLTIKTKQLENSILISLVDNGPGIPTEFLNKIFDPFFSTKQVGEGTGLGLSICFGIISEHNGRIWAENGSDQGTIFYIELPVVPIQDESSTITHKQIISPLTTKTPHSSPAGLRLLAIDDEPYLLKLLQRVLTRLGHHVETASNGMIALDKLKTKQFDLIICDVLMPDLLGTELYEHVVKKWPHLAHRFIFITGNVVDVNTRIFLEEEDLPWLPKPFLPADIENVIHQALVKVQVTQ